MPSKKTKSSVDHPRDEGAQPAPAEGGSPDAGIETVAASPPVDGPVFDEEYAQALCNALATTEPPKTGRPSIISPELIEDICDLIESGKTLAQVAKEPGMPSKATMMRWRRRNTEFYNAYYAAISLRRFDHLDEMLTVCRGEDIGPLANHDNASLGLILNMADRRIKTLQWMVERDDRIAGAYDKGMGENAKLVNPTDPNVIENHPMYPAIQEYTRFLEESGR